MVSAIFIVIGATLLNIIRVLLNTVSLAIPSQVQSALTWVFSSVNYFSGIFPVSDLMLASCVILTGWGFIYLIRVFLFFTGFIPTIGHKKLPSIKN